ncbi:peptidylprolyl isomerase [Neptunicella marina]|uniref:Peptidyl-prolyl cis-trans isomerase n=2 Tax=Neptunicella marina TaxID=2125989 RepID=A0A8J6J0Z0_9ALTE|nr:peptidylprolyl isomerase [Neptunicella marina]
MTTNMGAVELNLYEDKAPKTVANFIKYIEAGAFNQGQIYRVVRKDNDNGSPKIEVIQGGANPEFKDFEPVELETTQQTGLRHLDGTISMARDTPNTATSAFFICIGNQPSLDFAGQRNKDGQGFAAFGQVTKGMSVIKKIHQITATEKSEDAYTAGQILAEPVVIESITISQ